jgi:ABC-type phosphate/phosphonate transport system permease subunit
LAFPFTVLRYILPTVFRETTGAGIVYLLLGFVWDAIAVALASTVVGACLALPLHLIFSYYNAKNGARSTGLVSGTVVKL